MGEYRSAQTLIKPVVYRGFPLPLAKKKGPESIVTVLGLHGFCVALFTFPDFFETPLNSWVKLYFCARDFATKRCHWKSLNPYENLLQIERPPSHFPQKDRKCTPKPCKTNGNQPFSIASHRLPKPL